MDRDFEIGVYGLDMLGSALARSMAGKGFSVAASPSAGGMPFFLEDAAARGITLVDGPQELAAALKTPRTILARTGAGAPGGAGLSELLTFLEPDDILIDASDCWFRDTALRARAAAARNVHFLALGLSPNENSTVPLLFAGGRPDLYMRVSQWLHAIAPFGHGERGLGYLGAGPAGHFVRMTHGAIENAAREIVREARALLERGVGVEAGDLLRARGNDPLCQYFGTTPPEAGAQANRELARWAVRAGHELQIPMLTLEAAAGSRSWENREALAEPFCQPHGPLRQDGASLVAEAHGAMVVALIIAYTEGLAMMTTASEQYGLSIDAAEAVRVWRTGASLRARLLHDIQNALLLTPGLPNLLFDEDFSDRVMDMQELLRHAVWQADEWSMPTPALAAALRYIDTYRDAWLPINLVQPDEFHFTPRSRPAPPRRGHWEDEPPSLRETRFEDTRSPGGSSPPSPRPSL